MGTASVVGTYADAMDLGISGKVALVAAGSKGIGLATAKLLAAEGAKVSICARNRDSIDSALAEIGHGARGYVADVSKAEDLEPWVQSSKEDLGPISILVTNTGGPPAGAIDAMTDEQWLSGVDSTLMNVVRLSRLVIPGLKEQGWGRIVHVTSLVAKEPSPMLPISSTLRSGLMGFVRLQATELAKYGITANCVLPGHTLTDRQRHLAEVRSEREGISAEEALERQGSEVPLGRLAEPEEIADAIVYLCSQRASYITGTNLLVDGGLVKGLA